MTDIMKRNSKFIIKYFANQPTVDARRKSSQLYDVLDKLEYCLVIRILAVDLLQVIPSRIIKQAVNL